MKKNKLHRFIALIVIYTALVFPEIGLSDVPTFSVIKVADVPSGYGTFQSHNQKLVQNAYGLFMTYAYGYAVNTASDKEAWRLARSLDGGITWKTIWRGMTASSPPVLETDAHGSIFIIESDGDVFKHLHQPGGDGNVVFYRFDPEQSFTNPLIKTVAGGAAGKFTSVWDETRQRLYYMTMDTYHGPDTQPLSNDNFYAFDRDGNVVFKFPLTCFYVTYSKPDDVTSNLPTPGCTTSSPADANVHYPHLEIDGSRLYAAWTTAPSPANDPQRYRAIFYIYSDDGGHTWQSPHATGGVAQTIGGYEQTIVGNEHGPAQMVNIQEELTYTAPLTSLWLWNFVSKGGYLHFAYDNEISPYQQHYMRFSPMTGIRDIDAPGFRGQTLSTFAASGFFATDSLASTPLYIVSSTYSGGRLAILSSSDLGLTWTDYAQSAVAAPAGYNWYAVSGNRRLTQTGDIIGHTTTTKFDGITPSSVYFFRVHVVDRPVDPNPPPIAQVSEDLSVTLNANIDPVLVGNNITYTINVTNNSSTTATGVTLIDNLGGASFVPTGSSINCTFVGVVSCALDDLTSGASTTLTIGAVPSTAGVLLNTARAGNTGASITTNVQGLLSVSASGTGGGNITGTLNKVWGHAYDSNGQDIYSYLDVRIDCGSTCSGIYNANASVMLTATANSGSLFNGWSGCTSTSGNTCTVMMNTSKLVTASFNLPIPDLSEAALTSSQSATNLLINDRVQNTGTGPAAAFDVSYYLSTNATYETGTDSFLCARHIGSLAAGASSPITGTTSSSCAIPSVVARSYYVIARVDSANTVTESNETNNTFSAPVTISGVDLLPTVMSASRSGTKQVLVTETAKNQGNANAGSFTISYYLSTNNTYEPGTDIALASSVNGTGTCNRIRTSLNAGASNSVSNKTCYKPTAAANGVDYYVLVVDDAQNQVIEYNEGNNVRATGGTIRW